MSKFVLVVFIGLVIINCKKESEKNHEKSKLENIDAPISKSEECTPYFDFDEVDYYHIEINESKVFELLETKNINDSLLFSVIVEEKLSSISDSIYIDKLIDFGYTKKEISSTDFYQLNEIFCNENYSFSSIAACTPFYRDILIYRKSKYVTGIVKLCFECTQSTLVNRKKKLRPLNFKDQKWDELNSLLQKHR